MVYFSVKFFVKAYLLFSFTILLPTTTESNIVKGKLPEISGVLQFLQGLIRPYVRALQPSLNSPRPVFRARPHEDTEIEKCVKDRIEKLKAYLQDDDFKFKGSQENDDNLTLEGQDETTIIEFQSNKKATGETNLRGMQDNNEGSLQSNVGKYKKIRKKIKIELMKENVSEKTSNLVTSTLDEMIALIIENKCTWKSSGYHGANDSYSQSRVDRSLAMAQEWNQRWAELRNQYQKHAREKSPNSFPGAKLFLFFEQFHDFLAHIMKDIQTISGKYKMVCQLYEQDNSPINYESTDLRIGRNKTKSKKKHKCEHFKVCTDELTKYMTDFYYALNDTAVSTLRNYAAMYTRDVNTDGSQEKESVVTVLNNIADLAEYKISKIFRKETTHFQLDKNKDQAENTKALKTYIKNTIDNTRTYINNNLGTGLQSLRVRLLTTVKQDLSVNLDMDLGNLEGDFKGRICTVFSICNGQYAGRRYIDDYENVDRNSVYVKVKLSLDDELKEKLSRPDFGYLQIKKVPKKKGFKKKIYNNENFGSKNYNSKYKVYKNEQLDSNEHKTDVIKMIYKNPESREYTKNIKKTTHRESSSESGEILREKKNRGQYKMTRIYRKNNIEKSSIRPYSIPELNVTRTTISTPYTKDNVVVITNATRVKSIKSPSII